MYENAMYTYTLGRDRLKNMLPKETAMILRSNSKTFKNQKTKGPSFFLPTKFLAAASVRRINCT